MAAFRPLWQMAGILRSGQVRGIFGEFRSSVCTERLWDRGTYGAHGCQEAMAPSRGPPTRSRGADEASGLRGWGGMQA